LGDGYVEALWALRQGRFKSADLVTAWWDRAAEILSRPGTSLRRFGFITTNSITQTFSRRVLEHHLKGRMPMRLTFAVADHPWIKGADTADVRIAMTVVERGEPNGCGRLLTVQSEADLNTDAPTIRFSEQIGNITSGLRVGADLAAAVDLKANAAIASRGVQLMGAGFIVTPERAAALEAASEPGELSPIKPYRNGRDLADRARGVKVIDLFGMGEGDVRRRHPAIYQHLLETVKPERDRNNRATYRDNWWIFGEPRRDLRPALEGLGRYIVTVETAKHRWFRFMDAGVLADNKLIVVGSDDPAVLGVLSSDLHRHWFVANSGRIGVYDGDAVYVKGACFDRFPFPDLTGRQAAEIGALAEELDALRQKVLARHDFLTMTGLYNARARIGRGDLTESERAVHEAGCVGLIDHLHRRIDAVTAEAYGWPADLAAAEVVARLVALNQERSQEEAAGVIRFLRPDYQAARVRNIQRPVQTEAVLAHPRRRPTLPDEPGPLASALLEALRTAGAPVGPRALARTFEVRAGRRVEGRIEQTLAVLAVAGSVQRVDGGWFAPRRQV
jgi:hypothetical protein